jgi:hypothetical protein
MDRTVLLGHFIVMRRTLLASVFILFAIAPAAAQPRGGDPLLSVVPRTWKLQPPDPNWHGRRYVSPQGDAWLVLFESPARGDPITHMNATTFLQGERITYQKRGRRWVAVSGYRGDRIFYRKAILACRNRVWHHIAFEYPGSDKRAFDAFVTHVSRGMNAYQNVGCG